MEDLSSAARELSVSLLILCFYNIFKQNEKNQNVVTV